MIEDQSENGLPGVTLSEPSLKHSAYADLDISKCMMRTDDPRYIKPLTIPGGISTTLTDDIEKVLSTLATAQGISPTEALRKALATEQYLYGQRQKGATILLSAAGKEVREVLFR